MLVGEDNSLFRALKRINNIKYFKKEEGSMSKNKCLNSGFVQENMIKIARFEHTKK